LYIFYLELSSIYLVAEYFSFPSFKGIIIRNQEKSFKIRISAAQHKLQCCSLQNTPYNPYKHYYCFCIIHPSNKL